MRVKSWKKVILLQTQNHTHTMYYREDKKTITWNTDANNMGYALDRDTDKKKRNEKIKTFCYLFSSFPISNNQFSAHILNCARNDNEKRRDQNIHTKLWNKSKRKKILF